MIDSTDFVESPDDEHCLPAAFRMILSVLTGTDPGAAGADEVVGYVPGRGTWQFRALLGFAGAGLDVIDCELFNTSEFLRDPVGTILRQVGDPEVGQQNLAETDVDREVEALRECLANPRIRFEERVPTIADITRELGRGRLVLCNVNSNRLVGLPGHRGHSVVVTSVRDGSLVLQNPGPPPHLNQVVAFEDFEGAWRSPSEAMANYISVGVLNSRADELGSDRGVGRS